MKRKNTAGFRCYICGTLFPDQTERARPCAYDRFDQPVCRGCCEKCHDLEPFDCDEYNRRKKREEKEARKE